MCIKDERKQSKVSVLKTSQLTREREREKGRGGERERREKEGD